MPTTRDSSSSPACSCFRLSPRDLGAIASAIAPLMAVFVNFVSLRPALGETVKDRHAARHATCVPRRASFPLVVADIPPVLMVANRGPRGSLRKSLEAAPSAVKLAAGRDD